MTTLSMKIFVRSCSILLVGFFVGCTSNLSNKKPYLEAIGKEFVLQQDLYIYYFNNDNQYPWLSFPCQYSLGNTTTLAGTFSYGLPKCVEEKYIGSKNSYVTLNGILYKGNHFKVTRVLKHTTPDVSYYLYLVAPTEGAFAGQELNPFDIAQIFDNPPYSKTWSDPPLFKPEYALPLPADGIWWK